MKRTSHQLKEIPKSFPQKLTKKIYSKEGISFTKKILDYLNPPESSQYSVRYKWHHYFLLSGNEHFVELIKESIPNVYSIVDQQVYDYLKINTILN